MVHVRGFGDCDEKDGVDMLYLARTVGAGFVCRYLFRILLVEAELA